MDGLVLLYHWNLRIDKHSEAKSDRKNGLKQISVRATVECTHTHTRVAEPPHGSCTGVCDKTSAVFAAHGSCTGVYDKTSAVFGHGKCGILKLVQESQEAQQWCATSRATQANVAAMGTKCCEYLFWKG